MGKDLLGAKFARLDVSFWDCKAGRAGLDDPVNQGNERQRHQKRQPQRRGRGSEMRGRGPAKEPKAPPVPTLGQVVRACAAARKALIDGPNVVRDFWRAWDAEHGKRPDFALWRQLREGDRFGGRIEGVVDLMGRALKSGDVQVRWGALAMLPALPSRLAAEALGRVVRDAAHSAVPQGANRSVAWVKWLAGVWLGEAGLDAGQNLIQEQEGKAWKVGRSVSFGDVKTEKWLPVSGGVFRWWVADAIESLKGTSSWLMTAWQLRREARAVGASRSAGEALTLLNAAALARLEGQPEDSIRMEALALALVPERIPEVLLKRGQVAAWRVVEGGLQATERFPVKVDELLFPGEPIESERGQETARLFNDAEDWSVVALEQEMAGDADWEKLKAAGVSLRYPLAGLAWVAKKAPHHVVKKQTELLESGVRLALKHHCLGSAGRMLAVWPGTAAMVVEFARVIRASVKKMPVLRDWGLWQEWAGYLRAAWGRLDAGAINDDETLFFLHETLLDREQTTLNCLPDLLRTGDVLAALEGDPKLMSVLEHQRTLELWEVTSLNREREELAGWIWVNVVSIGEGAGGRFSALVLGSGGKKLVRGKLRLETEGGNEMVKEVASAVRELASGEQVGGVILAVDGRIDGMNWVSALECCQVKRVPSWESAFRSLREGMKPEEL